MLVPIYLGLCERTPATVRQPRSSMRISEWRSSSRP